MNFEEFEPNKEVVEDIYEIIPSAATTPIKSDKVYKKINKYSTFSLTQTNIHEPITGEEFIDKAKVSFFYKNVEEERENQSNAKRIQR